MEDKNPADLTHGQDGSTLLHLAAGMGYTKICHLIINNVEDKNPQDLEGKTPLHLAAWNGHTETCQLIMGNVEDKNPADHHGTTPQDFLARTGSGILHCNWNHTTGL